MASSEENKLATKFNPTLSGLKKHLIGEDWEFRSLSKKNDIRART
jgi:hypothetical protein